MPGGGQGKAKVDAESVQKCCHFRAAESPRKRAARINYSYRPMQVLKRELSSLEVSGLLGSVHGFVVLEKADADRSTSLSGCGDTRVCVAVHCPANAVLKTRGRPEPTVLWGTLLVCVYL